MKQEIEAPDKYNWLFGISLIPSLGTRWKLPIDLSLWKWQPSEAEKISGRANISVAFDILQEDNVTLFLAGGVGVFVSPGFPIAWDVGGGMEYHLSESLGFSLGIHTLIRYNKDQHPSPKAFTSPIFLSVGVMFTRPRE